MPGKNKIIKLNSISRHTVANKPCILLDNQQDSRNHVHRLALVPAYEQKKPDGSRELSFPDSELHWLSPVKVGLFPICFTMHTKFAYLVLGVVSKDVIPDFTNQGHFPSSGSAALDTSALDCEFDDHMARQWIATHKQWVQTNGILVYA